MIQSVVYKEWLKTRWFLVILTILGLMAVGNIFLKVKHGISFNEANKFWYQTLFQNIQYFKSLKFIPLAIGVLVGVAQYIPEITSKRIKLTFHLPVDENRILIMMLAYGIFVLFISFALLFLVFVMFSQHFFGAEIVRAAVISVTPWFLAGFAAYFLAALITLEAIWKYRIAYFLASCSFILFYFEKSLAGGYAPLNPKLAILTVLISLSLTFSAYRFRKGEM